MEISWRYHALWIHGTCQGTVINPSLNFGIPQSHFLSEATVPRSIGMEISQRYFVGKSMEILKFRYDMA